MKKSTSYLTACKTNQKQQQINSSVVFTSHKAHYIFSFQKQEIKRTNQRTNILQTRKVEHKQIDTYCFSIGKLHRPSKTQQEQTTQYTPSSSPFQ